MTNRLNTIGIVGARGHTGAELIRLIADHPMLELVFVASRQRHAQRVAEHNASVSGDLCYENLDPAAVAAKRADIIVLALPNGMAAPFVAAITAATPASIIVDLSADYRFDPQWYYGLPELTRKAWRGQRHIANPGCYATAMELSIAPLKDLLAAPPVCFGVSGYSGAGTKPSDKNNPELLRDNLMPYALIGHDHEHEASFQLGIPVEFMPHVAPHFRGLSVTTNLYLAKPIQRDQVLARFHTAYASEPLVKLCDAAPWLSHSAHQHHAQIGGFTLSTDGKRLVLVATLDNLLKGAATQAMQNINMALGAPELTGICTANPVATD
ncbi:MAG: N-acetyl-gamma-glutamyl-phosphate reductase [Xanthomonadales bacterium]|nr:N-acetyl-gamma-glutamyl-phosphate reductase [Xanthomonadales bacterium]